MSRDKRATVGHKVGTDMKAISIPEPPESVVSRLAGSRGGRFAPACKSTRNNESSILLLKELAQYTGRKEKQTSARNCTLLQLALIVRVKGKIVFQY